MPEKELEKEFKTWMNRTFDSALVSPFKIANAWAEHRFAQARDRVMDEGMNLEEAWHGHPRT